LPAATDFISSINCRKVMMVGFIVLANELVVFCVRANPKPRDTVLYVNAESTIMEPDAHGRKTHRLA
jgi:hypothetical protein